MYGCQYLRNLNHPLLYSVSHPATFRVAHNGPQWKNKAHLSDSYINDCWTKTDKRAEFSQAIVQVENRKEKKCKLAFDK